MKAILYRRVKRIAPSGAEYFGRFHEWVVTGGDVFAIIEYPDGGVALVHYKEVEFLDHSCKS